MLRAPLFCDVICAARALLAVAPDARAGRMISLFEEARVAARHVEVTGRGHPRWGDGSLMAAALSGAIEREPGLSNRDYCLCLAMVLSHLASAQGSQDEAHWTQSATVGSSSSRPAGISSPQSSQ